MGEEILREHFWINPASCHRANAVETEKNKSQLLLLMVQKSGKNSPVERKVVYPIIYKVFATSQVVSRISEASTG